MADHDVIKLCEFDVTQKIIESMTNVYSRAVLFSIRDAPKNAMQVAKDLDISVSTVYKVLSHLEHLALAEVDRFVLSDEGKKIKVYRSRIGRVEIVLNGTEPTLNLYPNKRNPGK